ncbi:MAG: Holliday junction branch migration protein RuvA [Clostridia bacterium]|nr:Holliday junction branch migration protein RuvA [Clostridia bacterium]
MFEFIRGYVAGKDLESVVLDVNGVGFKIYTSLNSSSECEEGESATFYTYMSVKEDDISLYGFMSKSELECFKSLISVSGVGPKVAVSLLSQISVADFSAAVVTGNHKLLSKVKGIGPKLAQRIVLELKDKMIKSGASAEADASTLDTENAPVFFGKNRDFEDAVEALCVLGHNQSKARAIVSSVYREGMTLEEIVKASLSFK